MSPRKYQTKKHAFATPTPSTHLNVVICAPASPPLLCLPRAHQQQSLGSETLPASLASAAPPHAAAPSTFPHLVGPLASLLSTLASVPGLVYRAGIRRVVWSKLTSRPVCKRGSSTRVLMLGLLLVCSMRSLSKYRCERMLVERDAS